MSDEKIIKEIERQVEERLNVEMLKNLETEIKKTRKMIEENNRFNEDGHNIFEVNDMKLFALVRDIEKRDIVDIIVMAARKYPKMAAAIFGIIVLGKSLLELIQTIIYKLI